jgi:uncharacterized protein YqhQ
MSFVDRVKESLASRAAEGIAVALTVLLIWAVSQLAPVILPAIEAATSKQVLLALLVTSLVLNVIFAYVVWRVSKKDTFRLKYSIYWDKHKNPHCPSCKTPVGAYGSYSSGKGYYCKPCGKLFPLADATGKNIDPTDALAEL